MIKKGNKTLIVGGVAGGAGTATRLRRLSEDSEIIIFERGEHVSYANCGLPYYLGRVIESRESLFVTGKEDFQKWFNIDVRLKSEVMKIHREEKEVEVFDHNTGDTYRESYDNLVLSPGAEPIRPPVQGIDLPGIFTLRSVTDTDRIFDYMQKKPIKKAVVVGGGFIGVEMAENLTEQGVDVSLVEMAPQVLMVLDPDMASYVQEYLKEQGVSLYLGNGLSAFSAGDYGQLNVTLEKGDIPEADMVIISIGVKPEIMLASAAGLETERGIIVNKQMQTSDPFIYALGDAVQIEELVSGLQLVIPLAGPANKQARIVAGNIAGRPSQYKNTQGTAVLKAFDMTIACTGANENNLRRAGIKYKHCIIHPVSRAEYYPGSSQMTMKLLFDDNGKILGAQAVGFGGVDKRIDVIATAIRGGKTVFHLQELELAYAPPFSSAKDPVNLAGFVAGNILNGDVVVTDVRELAEKDLSEIQLIDVRGPDEFKEGHIPGSVNIPLPVLRDRLGELSPEKETIMVCRAGKKAYFATRILMQKGFNKVYNLNGGYLHYKAFTAIAK